MCRIWGIVYGPGGPEAEDWTPEELAQIMFPALVRGGPHAWGWMAWDGEEIVTDKHIGRADTREAMSRMELPSDAKWVVGHTRYATHGSPEYMGNNHPVRHGNIIGVHNGVLRNHGAILGMTGRDDPKTEVDSEAIFAAVNRWGHIKGLSKVIGDMVTIFVNQNYPHIVNIARSNGRPLVLAKTKAGSLIFASEEQAIDATGIDHLGFFRMKENRLFKVREGTIYKKATFRKPTRAKPSKVATRTAKSKGGKKFSVGATRRAMDSNVGWWVPEDRREEAARRIEERKARTSLQDPVQKIRQQRTPEPRRAFGEKKGDLFYLGNGRWGTEREFIAEVMDEMEWDS